MSNTTCKKILVICQHFWPEEFKINDICTSWVRMGYEVDVVCGIPNYPYGKYFEGYSIFKKRQESYEGINIYRAFVVPRGSGKNPIQIFLNYISYPLFSIFKVLKLRKNNYDKILVYQLTPVFMVYPALVLKKILKKEIYIYILDLWPESLYSVYNIQSKAYKYIFNKISDGIYKRCDFFITTSRGIKIKLHKLYGIPEHKIEYVPNWAEKLFEEKKQNQILRDKYKNTFNIMFAGNIGPAQSFNTILNAAKICKDNGYKDIKWIIVGDGMTKNWVEERIKTLDIEDTVELVGRKPISEMPEYYDIADALLVALVKSDLFSITVPAKIQSYLASGKPVLASLDGEGAQIVEESGAGFSCDSENEFLLAEIVKKIYFLSPEQRRVMGEKGYSYYIENFQKEKLMHRLTNFIFR